MGWYSTIAVFSTCISLLVAVSLYIPRSFGHRLRIRRISIRCLQNISYSSQKRSLDIKSIRVTFHWPRRLSPFWAIVTADDFNYADEECDVALKRLEAKFWIFPVFFRFTAGPWIDTTLDGLKIHVRSSNTTPWWITDIRNNLLSTVLIGETIRLHNLTTKIYLGSSPAQLPINDSDIEDEEPNEEEPNEEEPNEDSEESNEEDKTEDPPIEEGTNSNELRARGAASQWQMVSPWNSRIYSFDHLEAELRRSWTEESGSFSMIAMNSRWIKVPAYSRMDVYPRSSELW
ncbi:hypothetical protein BJ912DRAFT_1090964 [Pholiota molesta]|nr:hypothetical protein BJ912DRAFT_1090964 [Pholiota molesta]